MSGRHRKETTDPENKPDSADGNRGASDVGEHSSDDASDMSKTGAEARAQRD